MRWKNGSGDEFRGKDCFQTLSRRSRTKQHLKALSLYRGTGAHNYGATLTSAVVHRATKEEVFVIFLCK